MRLHMPPGHRQYLAQLQPGGPVLRSLCQRGTPELLEAYNECINEMEHFRSQHKKFAKGYIAQFSSSDEKGTGGSDFMPALEGYRHTTSKHHMSRT